VLVALTLTPGCGKKERAVDQSTPKEACRTANKALLRLDEDTLLGCVIGTEQELAAVRAFVRFARAGQEFREAFVEEYGARAWEEFQDSEGAQITLTFEGDPAEVDRKIAAAEFDVQGDICTCRYQGEAIKLTRKKGKWYFQARDIVPVDVSKTEQLMAIAGVIRKHKARIGKPSVAAEQLDQEMGLELVELLRGGDL
jgi:hypothetical protein